MSNTGKKLVLILLLAIVLRSIGIISRPIWYDEAFSILFSEKGPAAIIEGTVATDAESSAAEEHPPAYYFILWGWIQIFGRSVVSARALSILFSTGTILIIYQIANHLFEQDTALAAALIAAILPFQIHYGQEIRMYVLLAFWLSFTTLAFLKRQWWLFCISAAMAQYTHNLAAFYLIPLAFTPIFYRDWKTLRALTLAGLAAIGIYSPWLFQLPAQISKVTSTFWIERPGIEKLFTLFLLYLPHLPLSNLQLLPGLLFATLVIVLAGFQTYRMYREKAEQVSNGLWLAYLSFFPPLLLWLVSQASPIYVERALLPAHTIFCIWLAWVLKRTKLPNLIQSVFLALILTCAGIGIFQHISYKNFPYAPFAEIDQSIQSRIESHDVIIHANKLSYLPSFYFDSGLPQGFILDPINSSVNTLSPKTQNILKINAFNDIEGASASASRVWYVVYQTSLEEFKEANHPYPDLEYLNKNFTLQSTENWGDIRLFLYSRNDP